MKRKSFAPPLQILKKKINNSYPAHVAGFFFCLASAEGAGLLFCLAAYQPRASVCSGLYSIHANYTAKTPKPFTGLYSGVSVDLRYSSAHNTADTQAAYAQPAPRWRAYRQAQHLQHIPDTTATPDAVQVSAAPYYNKVYKGAKVCPCCGSMPGSATHRRPCKPGGVSSYRLRIAGKCCIRRPC